jgi:hypothetical protein
MNQEDFFKIVGIVIVSCVIIYVTIKLFHLQTIMVEGMTRGNIEGMTNEAGTSASYAATIKSQVVKLQDELLVSKYRKEYESAIINLDDYIGYLMIKQTLNMKLTGDIKSDIESINNLNILKNSKESLNATMSFLDKQ